MPTLVLAHCSDLHLSAVHGRQNLRRAKQLLDFALRSGADHCVVTGDITANASAEDLHVARALFDSFGLLDPAKLTVIPGNHDIYGGVHTADDVLTFPGRCRKTDVDARVADFHAAFEETFRTSLRSSPEHPFPFLKVVGDCALVGTNSVARYSGLRNPLGSNGEFGKRQAHHLKELLKFEAIEAAHKILLVHHHFNTGGDLSTGTMQNIWTTIERQTMKLRGKKKLIRLFRKRGVELVLYGHVHQNVRYKRRGIDFVNGGGSVLGPGASPVRVNFVRVGGGGIEVDIRSVPAESVRVPTTRVGRRVGQAGHIAA